MAHLDRSRCPILFVKFTLIHPDDFIKEIPSLSEMIVQEYNIFCELDEGISVYHRMFLIVFKFHIASQMGSH